ncbi:hypothetical protein BH11CYA1_BH11CYA1_19160 [soil metagenome]
MADQESHLEDSISPDKRISESNPRELELAFRQVLVQAPKEGETAQADPLVESNAEEATAGKSRDLYKNGFTLWADIFYGVLVAPRQTMMILSDSSRFPTNFANFSSAALLVVLCLSITAFLKIKPDNATESLINCSLFVVSGLTYWATLSCILYYLSIWLRGHRLTFGNAFIATGWAFLPFAFFAPIACMRHTPLFLILATIPAFWFLALQWIAFQTSLRTSTIKLALILLVVPPVLTMVYIFWIGLAGFSIISQLLAAL